MTEDDKNQAPSEKRRDFSNLRALGITALAILLYLLLLDAVVETLRSDSSLKLKWWVVGIVAAHAGLNALLWRRLSWATLAALSFFVLLVLLAVTAWLPGGLTHGVTLAWWQPTSTVLSFVTAFVILLTGIGLIRMKFIPIWGRALIGLLALYGVAAFGWGIKTGISYADIFRYSDLLRVHSLWEGISYWWLPGAFVGAVVLAAALIGQLIYGLLKVRGQELRTWGVQVVTLSLCLAIAAAGFRGSLGMIPIPTGPTSEGPQVTIQAIALDEAGTKATSNVPSDAPTIYAVWKTEGVTKRVELRGRWIAVGAEGLKSEAELSSSTQPVDQNATGSFSFMRPADGWKAGRYRAEISITGGAPRVAEFVIAGPPDVGERFEVVLAKGVTEADKPLSPTTEFPDNIETIYAVLPSTAPETSVRADWIVVKAEGYGANTRLAESTVSGSTKVGGRQGATGAVLWLQAPQGGFPPGDYQVNIHYIHYPSSKSGEVPREVSRAFKVVPVPILLPPPSLVASQAGVVSRYFADHSYNSFKKSDVVQSLSLDWNSPPVFPTDGKRFWIEWEGVLSIPSKGQYHFKIEGDGDGFLYLDGKQVIQSIWEQKKERKPKISREGSIWLENGGHTIRLAAIQGQVEGKFALKWKKEGDQDHSSVEAKHLGHTKAQREWKRGPRQAAQVGIEWLQSDSIAWQRQHRCFGCHVQGQAIMGLSVAAGQKYAVSEDYFKELVRFTKKVQHPPTGTYHKTNHITATQFAAMSLSFFDALTNARQDDTLIKAVGYILTQQRPDGEIPIDHPLPPIDQGSIMTTANSVTAFLQAFKATGDARYKDAADRALGWIAASKPDTTQDKIFKVIALARFGTPDQKRIADQVVEQLKAEQLKDGSWGERRDAPKPSDFTTGQVLCAFKEAGVGVNTLEFRRGVRFLLNSQRITGFWEQGSAQTDFARTMWPVICLAGAFENVEFVPDGTLQLVSDIQRAKKPTKNLVIILDVSGSMNERLGKTTKWKTALEVFNEVVEKLPDDFNVGLRVYSHRHPPARKGTVDITRLPTCTDTELLVPVQKLDRGRILSTINRLKPRGETPLVYSVLQTIGDLKGVGGGSVVLITDGIETCKGDPLKATQQLKDSGIDITLHIVGFAIEGKKFEEQLKQLKSFAETTGGRYFSAQSGQALARSLLIAAVEKLPYEIFDANGKRLAKGETGDPPEGLPPGKYRVVVQAVDQELVAENVTIEAEKERVLKVVLRGGRFSLKEGEKELAAVSLELASPSGEKKGPIESGPQGPKELKTKQPAEKVEKPVLPAKKAASIPEQEKARPKGAASKKETSAATVTKKIEASESPVVEKPTPPPQEVAKKEVPNEQPPLARLGRYMAIAHAPVRGQPRPEADVVSYLEAGMRVTIVEQAGDYLKVQSKHGRPPGYVLRKDVVFVGE